MKHISAFLLLLAGIAFSHSATAQVPTITSFTAAPANIHLGQSATLSWVVSGASSLSIDNAVDAVTGTSRNVSPAVTTTYTLTATNAGGSSTAAKTVTVSPFNYIIAYDSALQGSWVRSCWESAANPVFTDFAAVSPGRTGNVIEVRFAAANAWNAFGLADRLPGWDNQYKYLNEMRTIEFDIYLEPDSTGVENLSFILEDAGLADEPNLVDFIPGWAGMTAAQRYGHWFHIIVDLAQIHPHIPRFAQFLLFNGGEFQPHFRVSDVKLGWLNDTTPPVVTLGSATLNLTYDQLALAFTTSEATIYRVEYGVNDFSNVVQGNPDDWSSSHSATLTGLTPGTTYQYRIVALDHRTDPTASPNQGIFTNTFVIPPVPTTPPTISGLTVNGITGNRTNLAWTTNRPSTAVVTYHKAGSPNFTRTLSDFVVSRVFVLDLLEPSTTYTVTTTVSDAFHLSASQSTTFATGANGMPTVTITVNPASSHPISPWIYGINFYDAIPDAPHHLTFDRMGGNRWTAYNWENNASNAGSDWFYSSDDFLGGGDTPGEAVRPTIVADRARGMASLMTVQLQGYVAADKNGNVDINDPNHLANRFKQVVDRKGAAFTATPSTTDAYVYMDEFLWALRGKFANDIFADPATPTFVSLDNEPELWPYTHAEIQAAAPTPDDYIQKTIALTMALKDVAPAVQIFGPVHYGFNGIVNWQSAPGFTDTYWFTDKYLDEMKAASTTAGRRLLDVYDFHWYSEALAEGTRIGDFTGTSLTDAEIQAIVQSPRSLWDPTYREDSWIADYFGGPIYILGRLQAKIDARWPGTKLSLTEYENGGNNHIAGAIAQADNLGAFGQLGVFAANFWPTSATYPFVLAGFKMYRDYDGNLGSFGDISLPAVSTDNAKVTAYVSRDSVRADRYVIVALNRSSASQDVSFSGLAVSGTARVYRVQGASSAPAFVGEVPANLGSWIVTLPPLSVSTIEITPTRAATLPTDFNGDGKSDLLLFQASSLRTYAWYLNGPTYIGAAPGPTLPAGWSVAGVADFNGDGQPDLLLFHASDLRTYVWYLNGTSYIGSAPGPTLPAGWSVAGVGDFNVDGHPDLLLFQASSLRTYVWYMNGPTYSGAAPGPTLPAGWSVAGVADFNVDGKPDLVLFQASSLRTYFWYLNGPTYSGAAPGPTLPAGWSVAGVEDFNGDGKPDLALFQASSLRTYFWYLNGPSYSGAAPGPTLPAGWSLAAP